MHRPAQRTPRGFTLIEMMVTVAVAATIVALAALSLKQARPRASLLGATTDLQALLHGARQQALASGNDVAVMVFPAFQGPGGTVGRIIVYEDGDRTLWDATSSDKFDDYDPEKPKAAPHSEVISTLDLPSPVVIGPAAGRGAAALPAPWSAIPVNSDCTFCDGSGAKRRGAVVFDSRGRALFYNKAGAPLAVEGGSLSIHTGELGEVRTLAVGASTGAVRAVTAG